MLRKILLCFFILMLTGCSNLPVYRPALQQGNVITKQMLSKLHRGMTQEQVEAIMGSPILESSLVQNRIAYVYTFKPYHFPLSKQDIPERAQQVTLVFQKGKLSEIKRMAIA